MAEIGKRNRLAVVREASHGVYLDGEESGEILLPRRYLTKKISLGDKLDVFIYLDSEDRLVATTETPLATVGDIVCLKVIGVNRDIGAFLDWGLSKDLLLPFREQERPLQVGEKVVVAVYVDSRTNRIVASMRIERHLPHKPTPYMNGQSVSLLIVGETPLGYKAIVENSHVGLLYRDRVSVPLEVGQQITGYVRGVRPGGKIDLSLDRAGYKRVAPLKEQIVQELERNHGQLDFDDDSSPEKIRERFGASKKAFKQALGALYKARRIRFRNPGIELLDNSDWNPRGS